MLRMVSFDVVLVGLKLPDMSAWDFLAHLKTAFPHQKWALVGGPVTEQQEGSADHGHAATEPEQLERAAAGFAHETQFEPEQDSRERKVAPAHESIAFGGYDLEKPGTSEVGALEVVPQGDARGWQASESVEEQIEVEEEAEGDSHPSSAPPHEGPSFPRHAAPSVAPEGRTLEHEVLEDDEMEFHPVPENIEALREVAGDEELVRALAAGATAAQRSQSGLTSETWRKRQQRRPPRWPLGRRT